MLTVLAFYFGNRFGQVFDFNTMEITDGALATVNSIVAAPAAISTASVPMLYAIGLAITVLIVWLYTFMYAGNYRYGEEAGSAKWGTLKEGVAFKDQTDPSNNLLFTKNYGLALKKPKFDLEHDRNLNVMVIGGSGSGKTRNYVKPNLMQLNASYFLTDPKGTSLPECGYLFRDNGYRIKVFNTIEFNKSMHYNPLKYVKTDADILSFVNCLISNTNGDKQSGGDPFWENSERLLYTALIALLRDWFPPEDYSLDGLLTLLSMAEAKENDENFKSPLDMIFDEIETGKVYERNPFYQGPSTSSSYADAESDRMAISENTTDEFTWQSSLMERNNDGLSPAREGGLTSDQDFALANYKMFKVAAGKTLKSIIISCNVRMAPMRIEQVRELLKYDEMNLDEMGDPGQRTAVFAIMSDTDKTFSFLHAIMMWQSIDLQNRGIGEKVYNAVLSGRLDLACFCGDSSKYYSVLTRSTRQDGALQVTEIDRKGPIGHRLLTGPKQLELPGCGATVAAVSDVSRCTEQEILDAVGFKMQQGLNSKAVKCKAGHQRLDAERTKTDLPKERKSPAR